MHMKISKEEMESTLIREGRFLASYGLKLIHSILPTEDKELGELCDTYIRRYNEYMDMQLDYLSENHWSKEEE